LLIQRLKRHLDGGGLKALLLRGGLGSLVLKVASTRLGLVVAVVLAPTLGPEGYGEYAYVFALISMLAIPTQVRAPIILVRGNRPHTGSKTPRLDIGTVTLEWLDRGRVVCADSSTFASRCLAFRGSLHAGRVVYLLVT
jgi:hypothetical protein